ncbi:MAG: hypothetical protein NTZ67_02900 [Gammaproteobacteria bacterium]|nr:hypothetical protein [Gammaproteobacteria bacterium]
MTNKVLIDFESIDFWHSVFPDFHISPDIQVADEELISLDTVVHSQAMRSLAMLFIFKKKGQSRWENLS